MTAKCFPDTTVIGWGDSHQGSQSVGKSVSKSSSESDGRCLHQDRGEGKDEKQGLKIVTHQNLTPPISLISNLHTMGVKRNEEKNVSRRTIQLSGNNKKISIRKTDCRLFCEWLLIIGRTSNKRARTNRPFSRHRSLKENVTKSLDRNPDQ